MVLVGRRRPGSFLLMVVLLTVRPKPGAAWAAAVWPGGRNTASAVLQVVATPVMTATALTFSLTVVALQPASQQCPPAAARVRPRH
ncbi:hypothetical protein GCM10009767_16080 [Kocuria aegyptia]|uniref:Secreted protein n=1 Tax=Kocuria aegyptia TaxID=330943 RepID=A0ABP4WQC0_9MICC